MNEYNFTIDKINFSKILKTLRGSIKKGIFYLALNIPYEKSQELVLIEEKINDYSKIEEYLQETYPMFLADAKIRYCDDLLDNVLAKQIPVSLELMKKVVSDFELDMSYDCGDIATLFRSELDLLENYDKYTTSIIQEKIREIIEIRPCDYFFLINKLKETFGSKLSEKDYQASLSFFKEFQRLRDLFDDMMSVEEDIIKKDYNNVVLGHDYKVPYSFFDLIVKEKFNKLKFYLKKLNNHPNKDLFYETIRFWELEYENLFKPLLTSFYVDMEEFKKLYFMIKQI